MLPADAVLEEVTLGKIISSGHSRVPIHQPGNRSVHDTSSSASLTNIKDCLCPVRPFLRF